MIGLLLLVGLAVDIGLVFVARNELQVFADESAIAATFELDGTLAGITRARDAAIAGPGANRWNFGTEPVANVQAEFATAPGGPFDSNPQSGQSYRFVRARATATVKLYFLPLAPGIANSRTVTASAIASQVPQSSLGDGLSPFAPTAHDAADPNFGFTIGQLYTLRWGPPGSRDQPGGTCSGDVGFVPGGTDDRGYVNVGQGSGAAAVRETVINNSFFLPAPLTVGSTLSMLTGQQSVPNALEERYNQDTDVTHTTFNQYLGNGRRLLATAVTGGGDPATVVGFGLFFLHPSPCGTKNTDPCCAEYVGPAVVASSRRGAGTAGLARVQLVQ